MRNFRTLFALFIMSVPISVLLWSFIPSKANNKIIPEAGVALAQGPTCPVVVQSALAATTKDCSKTGRNQMCYGNNSIQAQPQPDVSNFAFKAPGNIVDIAKVRTLALGPLDMTNNTWGIAVLRVQANLPDTNVGQNVTLLMFGDVGISSQPGQLAATPAATGAAPSMPSTVATAAATAVGTAAAYKPLQSFYFRTGVGDPACNEAPRDGILIQSPQGAKTKVTFTADGVQLDLGSTGFLQAQASGEMIVSTLEGSVAVTAFGQTQTASAGLRVRVPLDANLIASGPPLPPETYDYGTMLALPVKNLPVAVNVAAPKPPANATTSQWNANVTTSNMSAPCQGSSATETITVQTDPSGKTMWLTGSFGDAGIYTSTGPDTFSGVAVGSSTTSYLTLKFTSPTHAEAQGSFGGVCTGSLHISMDKGS